MDTKHKLSLSSAPALADLASYRRLVGQLINLTITKPYLAYSVHIHIQFICTPTEEHLYAAHRVLRYLKSAPAQGLFNPNNWSLHITAFCDAAWASYPITWRSVTGYYILLSTFLVSWKTKKQAVVSRSYVEAEYRVMANALCELVWLVRVLKDFHIDVFTPIPFFCDTNAAMHIARNPVFHERTKHVEIDCHVVWQYVSHGLVPRYISTVEQPADLFTKALPADQLSRLSSKLNVSNILHTLSFRGVLSVLIQTELQGRSILGLNSRAAAMAEFGLN
ncbi:unnamed protein product [Rhodiola kirilowii]